MSTFKNVKKYSALMASLPPVLLILNLSACGGDSSSSGEAGSNEPAPNVDYDGIWQGGYTTEGNPSEKPLYMIVKDDKVTFVYDGDNLVTTASIAGNEQGFEVEPTSYVSSRLEDAMSFENELLSATVTEEGGLTVNYSGDLIVQDYLGDLFQVEFLGLGFSPEQLSILYTGYNPSDDFQLAFITKTEMESPQAFVANLQKTALYEMPVPMQDLVGAWQGSSVRIDTAFDAPSEFNLALEIAEDGSITGSDSNCSYEGSISLAGESINAFDIELDATNCEFLVGSEPLPLAGFVLPIIKSTYEGVGFLSEDKSQFIMGLENGIEAIGLTLNFEG